MTINPAATPHIDSKTNGSTVTTHDPFVTIDRVSKTYQGRRGAGVRALSTTSFNIARGEFLAIVGPSGCGKSTLLKLLAGLSTPTTGTVTIDGRAVERPITEVGIVFQNDLLLPWRTAIDNIMIQAEIRRLPKHELRERSRELLSMVGLDGFEDKHPDELSGGMRQRVSICRALVHDPPLLLLDEPFGALDALTRDQMAIDIQRLMAASPKTVLLITHSIPEAILLADRVFVFTDRPGTVASEIVVDLPRPRGSQVQNSSRFAELVRSVRTQFEELGILNDVTPTESTH